MLAGRCRLLEPLRRVYRVTGHEGLAGGGIARYDLARVDSDPHLEDDAVLTLELEFSSREPVPHLVRGPDGAQGVVLVDDRHAEDGHHRIADELLDRAAVVLEDGPHLREVPGMTARMLLGRAVRRGRRVGDVGEHDRHRLANLMRRLGLGERAAARVTEAGGLHVRLTADAAYVHSQV